MQILDSGGSKEVLGLQVRYAFLSVDSQVEVRGVRGFCVSREVIEQVRAC